VSFFQVICYEFIDSHFECNVFFLVVIVIPLVMKAYLHAIAVWFNSPTPAQSPAGITLSATTLYAGYNVPELSTVDALGWITHINVCISCRVHYAVELTVHFFSHRSMRTSRS